MLRPPNFVSVYPAWDNSENIVTLDKGCIIFKVEVDPRTMSVDNQEFKDYVEVIKKAS